MARMVEYALSYVKKFHAVVPVGAWTYKDKAGETVSAWKTPLIKGWTQKPLTTEAEVRREWNKYASWNRVPGIGVVTGQICGGYIVIDLDRDQDKGIDGYDYLLEWQRETGLKLPETWTALTGRGGYHLWYKTDKAIRGYVNEEIGVDLRADGNFVVVPPSLHQNTNLYQWEIAPNEIGECTEANEAVFEFINYCRPDDYQFQQERTVRRGSGGARKMVLMPQLPEGGRHNALISVIGTMNRLGFSDEAIEAAIRVENEQKCNPPLSESELQREIFSAIYSWEKGVPAEQWKDKEIYLKEMKTASAQQQRYNRALANSQS